MMAALRSMNAIGAGAPTALISAATAAGRGGVVRGVLVGVCRRAAGVCVSPLPVTIEWLSDNGSCYVAGDTRSFARDIGLEPRTTPVESPQSNGMAEYDQA